jgi:hypothetical protein
MLSETKNMLLNIVQLVKADIGMLKSLQGLAAGDAKKEEFDVLDE